MKRSLVLSLIFVAACASAPDKPQQAAPPGNPYTMEATTIPVGVIPAAVIHDAQRNKDLELSIEYPTHGGPYPVIIFSPGYGGSRADYVGLSAFWASHGYVVIKISHADAGVVRETMREQEPERRDRRQRTATQPQQPAPFRPDPAEMWQTQKPEEWRSRAADVTSVIDSLPRLIEQYPEIKERVDANRIGVGGHSYGAFTAMLIGGVRPSNIPSLVDARVKAVEAMSPPGLSSTLGLTADSFTNLRIPALFLTGSRDLGATESEDVAWRRQAYELSPSGDKWFVSIEGASRFAFTGRIGEPIFAPAQPSPYPTNRPPIGGAYPQQQPMPSQRGAAPFRDFGLTNSVRTISLAFWDTYLKNDNAGREYLNKLHGRGDVQVAAK